MTIGQIANNEAGSSVRTKLNSVIDAVNVGLQFVTRHVTAAELRDLFTSPITLLAAPGAGKIIVPWLLSGQYTFGTAVYDAVGGDDIKLGAHGIWNAVLSKIVLGREQSEDTYAFAVVDGNSTFNSTAIANQPLVWSSDNNWIRGLITAATLAAGGSGYAPGDTVFVETDEIAILTIDTVSGGGAVTTFHISTPGFSLVGIQDTSNIVGTGTGFTVNVTAVALGDGTLDLVLAYLIV